jgi:tetratricopeptide (TPR) repeat protein
MRAMCLLLGTVLLCAPFGHAEAQKDKKAPSPDPAEQQNRDLAKKHYDQGITHYNLGEFDAAVTEFKAAYALTSEPGLLFNVAQAYRLKEDYKQALYFYKTYLRIVPDAPNRADVERWIAELERLQSEQTKLKNSKPQDAIPAGGKPPPTEPGATKPRAEPPPPVEPPTVVQPAPAAAPARGRTWKIAGLSTAGAGLVLLGVGAWMGSVAAGDWDDINQYADQNGTWNATYQDKWDEAESYDTLSTVAYVGGAAAVLLGGTFYYLGMRDAAESRTEVGVALGRGSATLTLAWGF